MSTGTFLGDQPILGLHPVTLMLVIGIMLQGLCECFITPRYLEYFSYHAPKGEEGLYLGFSQMDSKYYYTMETIEVSRLSASAGSYFADGGKVESRSRGCRGN